MNTINREILTTLINQVAKAVPDGQSEQAVTTIVTRPMWDQWCKAVGIPIGSSPTDWQLGEGCRRIYGSRTIVVESDVMASVSFATPSNSTSDQPKRQDTP